MHGHARARERARGGRDREPLHVFRRQPGVKRQRVELLARATRREERVAQLVGAGAAPLELRRLGGKGAREPEAARARGGAAAAAAGAGEVLAEELSRGARDVARRARGLGHLF